MKEKSIYEFTLNDIDGNPVNLTTFKDKVILLVNVASKCGFTPQYKNLQELYEKYKDNSKKITKRIEQILGVQQ